MKVRIQVNDGSGWCDDGYREAIDRGPRSVRVDDIYGRSRSFYLTTGWILGHDPGARIHPDDVPALAALPLRLAKTKPFDLDAHPLAPVLRRVVVMVADATGQIGGDPDYALDAIQDTAIVRDAETCEVLTSCAALALAGLAALDKPKGGA